MRREWLQGAIVVLLVITVGMLCFNMGRMHSRERLGGSNIIGRRTITGGTESRPGEGSSSNSGGGGGGGSHEAHRGGQHGARGKREVPRVTLGEEEEEEGGEGEGEEQEPAVVEEAEDDLPSNISGVLRSALEAVLAARRQLKRDGKGEAKAAVKTTTRAAQARPAHKQQNKAAAAPASSGTNVGAAAAVAMPKAGEEDKSKKVAGGQTEEDGDREHAGAAKRKAKVAGKGGDGAVEHDAKAAQSVSESNKQHQIGKNITAGDGSSEDAGALANSNTTAHKRRKGRGRKGRKGKRRITRKAKHDRGIAGDGTSDGNSSNSSSSSSLSGISDPEAHRAEEAKESTELRPPTREVMVGLRDRCIDHSPIAFPNQLALWSCHQHARILPSDVSNQIFVFTTNGQLQQLHETNMYCVDSASVTSGDPVSVLECEEGKESQYWTYVTSSSTVGATTPNGTVILSGFLLNDASGLCLESRTDKELVALSPCTFDCNQLWRVTYMEENAPHVSVDILAATSGESNSDPKIKSAKTKAIEQALATALTKRRQKQQQEQQKKKKSKKQSGEAPSQPLVNNPLGQLVRSTKAGRILCWVLTMPKDHNTKTLAVNNTWGRDCDYLIFASQGTHRGLNIVEVDLGTEESRSTLWPKSQQMWMYVYMKYIDKFDWFIKADDDTYIVFPYLREYLSKFDKNAPIHLGRRLRGHEPGKAYYSGGAGIILSHEALKRLGDRAAKDPGVWVGNLAGPEDMYTSMTLREVGVYTVDTRDKEGRHQFLTVGLEAEHDAIKAESPTFWLWDYSRDAVEGHDCCSPRWIATHYISYTQMYAIHTMRLWQCRMPAAVWPYLELPENVMESAGGT